MASRSSKTGGGVGTNQYAIKGVSVAQTGNSDRRRASELDPPTGGYEWGQGRDAFRAEHADDQVTFVAYAASYGSFGIGGQRQAKICSDAFDEVLASTPAGPVRPSEFTERFKRAAARIARESGDMKWSMSNIEAASIGYTVEKYLLQLGSRNGVKPGWVNLADPPFGDLPVYRNIPEGFVKVFTAPGGDPACGAAATRAFLVPVNEYEPGHYGMVIDDGRYTEIAPTHLG